MTDDTPRSEILWAPNDGAPFASFTDLVAVSDRPSVPLIVERWKQRVLMQGPSLPQIVAISEGARKHDRMAGTVVRDRVRFVALTMQHCIAQPRLDATQAQNLAESKNPVILEALSNFAWKELLDFSLEEITAMVADAADIPPGELTDGRSDPDGDLPL